MHVAAALVHENVAGPLVASSGYAPNPDAAISLLVSRAWHP